MQDEVLVGSEAKNQFPGNAENTFNSVKRLIGTPFHAVSAELQYVPFMAQAAPDGSTILCCPAR